MLVLFETPAGFALFKVTNEKRLAKVDNIFSEFESPDRASEIVKLKAFYKFGDTTEALAAASAMVESKLGKQLKRFLKKNIVKKELDDELAIADSKLGGIIKEKLGVQCVVDDRVSQLMRGIRLQLTSLVDGLEENQLRAMQLGLGHTLSRYKLKFSPDKVDIMIVQAIGLLDELDKEINTYAMRVKEWYGWHFPEMTKIVSDNLQYAQVVIKMGLRSGAATADFSSILEEEVETAMKESAVVSMGTDISAEDLDNIRALAQQVVDLMEYRKQLFEYLQNRMQAIAPNLTIMVGELVGARLIAHAGSLMNLAKQPASTVQILGAEKALFRALKTKHDTPKYGLIYHASLIGQTAQKNKGKISRVLAAKTALSIRVDALGDATGPTIGLESRAKVEARMRQLEGSMQATSAGSAKTRHSLGASVGPPVGQASRGAYNPALDVVMGGAARSTPGGESTGQKRKSMKNDDENGDAEERPGSRAEGAPGDGSSSAKKHKEKKEKSEKKAKKARKDSDTD